MTNFLSPHTSPSAIKNNRSIFKNNGIRNHVTNLNPLGANLTKWSNTLKHFVGNMPTNCLSVFDHFVKLALKGLRAPHPSCVWTSKCVIP